MKLTIGLLQTFALGLGIVMFLVSGTHQAEEHPNLVWLGLIATAWAVWMAVEPIVGHEGNKKE